MRNYELTFIIDAQLASEKQDEVIADFLDMLRSIGVEIINVEKWGKKKLAYQIEDRQYGYYIVMQFKTTVETLADIETYLKLSTNIFRYLFLHHTPKILKKIAKEASRREHEAKYNVERERALVVEHAENSDEESIKSDQGTDEADSIEPDKDESGQAEKE